MLANSQDAAAERKKPLADASSPKQRNGADDDDSVKKAMKRENDDDADDGGNEDEEEDEDDDEEDDTPYRDIPRFKTWRKHTRDVYRTCLHFEPSWPCRSLQLLPYIERSQSYNEQTGNRVMKMKAIAGTTTCGSEQQFLKVLEICLPVGPEPPSSLRVLDRELSEVGGYGCAPDGVSVHVALRFFHDGDVNRIRYMPSHPNVFLTASSNGNLYLFDNASLSHTKAPNQPARPVLPLPPVEPVTASDRERAVYETALEQYQELVKNQERWDSKTKGAGQHCVKLTAAAASSNPVMAGSNKRSSQTSSSTSAAAAAAASDDNSNSVQAISASSAAVPTSCEWHALRREGHLAAAFNSGCVAEWNFGSQPQRKASNTSVTLEPSAYRYLPDRATDVQYSLLDENALAASCRNGATYIFDGRLKTCNFNGAVMTLTATVSSSFEEATTVAWSPFDPSILAVGYGSGITRIWDIRGGAAANNASSSNNVRAFSGAPAAASSPLSAAAAAGAAVVSPGPVSAFGSHKKGNEVTSLQWNPHDRAVLATGGEDGNVVWVDTVKQRCMFVHCGHTKSIKDMCWSWEDSFAGMMLSADDASVIAWSPRTHVLE